MRASIAKASSISMLWPRNLKAEGALYMCGRKISAYVHACEATPDLRAAVGVQPTRSCPRPYRGLHLEASGLLSLSPPCKAGGAEFCTFSQETTRLESVTLLQAAPWGASVQSRIRAWAIGPVDKSG